MEVFTKLTAKAAPMDMLNVNTDYIFPARFIKKPREPGYQDFCFHDGRFDEDENERPEFPLNQDKYRGAEFIVGNANFGCGSSREGAVYTLQDFGLKAVIAPSFGDIFASNAVKNGFLPVRLPEETCVALRRSLSEANDPSITVDLEKQVVTGPGGEEHAFEIEPFQKHCILNGLGEISLTLQNNDKIDEFDQSYREDFPWLYG
ncbi:MAG: 3-isopropylmalate dehydratase small subunit [Rhodospirillales bacterium]|jgi:3-isopropylmalate/(R)-2-methylmalate dehydratase small subunit